MTTRANGSVTVTTDLDDLTSTHMSTHTSARTSHVEVIRTERRRRWLVGQKRAIVAESQLPGASFAGIARKHGIGTGQLYSWRRRFLSELAVSSPGFARVEMTDVAIPTLTTPIISAANPAGLIEITLPGGASVRVDARVDERALRRVLKVLRER
jgi:transposase